MAKLFFIYGTMGSSKSSLLICKNHSYKEKGKKTLIIKPTTDTRNGAFGHGQFGSTCSRPIPEGPECLFLDPGNFKDLPKFVDVENLDIIFVDESQFCKKEDIYYLSDVVDDLNIPVMCYGLKTTAEGDLFEGSSALLAIADELEETIGICDCGRRATHHIRVSGGKYLAGNAGCESKDVKYESCCRRCFKKHLRKQGIIGANEVYKK